MSKIENICAQNAQNIIISEETKQLIKAQAMLDDIIGIVRNVFTNNDNTEGLIAEDDIYMLTDKCCEISEMIVQMRMPLTMANMAESEFKVM